MVTKPGRRWRSAAGLVLAAMLVAPAVVRAQLLPNLPTRYREKPPCVAEPPFYKMVRHQYFGYYPTCWRRFPPGWTCPCPNPELPNFQAALQKKPLESGEEAAPAGDKDKGRADDPFESDRGGDRRGPNNSNVPPLPDPGTSPFDNPGDMRPASPPPLDGGAGRPSPDAPARSRDDRTEIEPPKDSAPAVAAAAAPATRLDLPAVADAAPEMPPLDQVGPATGPAVATARPDPVAPSEAELAEETASAPVPSAPDPTLPVPSTSTDSILATTPAPAPIAAPAQAPQRRGLVSTFINRIRRR